jgi:hypothetical protein
MSKKISNKKLISNFNGKKWRQIYLNLYDEAIAVVGGKFIALKCCTLEKKKGHMQMSSVSSLINYKKKLGRCWPKIQIFG